MDWKAWHCVNIHIPDHDHIHAGRRLNIHILGHDYIQGPSLLCPWLAWHWLNLASAVLTAVSLLMA